MGEEEEKKTPRIFANRERTAPVPVRDILA
jgi:hypothetical protein